MQEKVAVFALVILSTPAGAQILTTEPFFPTVDDTVTLYYNAEQGNGELIGAETVYAHTGVITSESRDPSDWKFTVSEWGRNSAETRLQAVGENLWRLSFHIRSFYRLPSNIRVLKLAFVFRNASSTRVGRTADGGDIFTPVYAPGLHLALASPLNTPFFFGAKDSAVIDARTSEPALISLYQDNQRVAQTQSTVLRYSIKTEGFGVIRLEVRARNERGDSASLSFEAIARPPVEEAPLPGGLSDGINEHPDGITLVLHAPHKEFVFIIGDFNDWRIDLCFQMKRTPDGARYWLQLDDLEPVRTYLYQYLIDGGLRVADPYSEEYADPFHDRFIPSEIHPDPASYPQGLTTEIASVYRAGQPAYNWSTETVRRPPAEELIIYELLLRDFLARHNYDTLSDTLDYLVRLGVNAIELLPVMEFSGNDSWGYNTIGHFAPDKYYGTKPSLQRFVDTAHGKGLTVILDLVLNHMWFESPLVRLYGGDLSQSPWFNAVSPNPVYDWGIDFNHESVWTRKYVDRVIRHWLREYRVDGFRFDFTKGWTNVPGEGWARDASRIRNLRRMAEALWQQDSTAYVILEHFCENSEEEELAEAGMLIWGNMNSAFSAAAMGNVENGQSDFSAGSYKQRGWSKPHLVTYMESHDEERLMARLLTRGRIQGDYRIRELETALQRIKLAAAFLFALPGPKMIWQFEELGYDFSINTNGRLGRKPIRWDYLNRQVRRDLYDFFSRLIRLKLEHPAFKSTTFSTSLYGAGKRITLSSDAGSALVIGNFDVFDLTMKSRFPHTGLWYDVLSGDSIDVSDRLMSLDLGPGEFHIYLDGAWSWKDHSSAAAPRPGRPDPSLQQNYPNPFNPRTRIDYSLPHPAEVRLEIYNLAGQRISTLVQGRREAGFHHIIWDGRDGANQPVSSGVYLARLSTREMVCSRKMLLLR